MCYIRQNSNIFQCAPEALQEFRMNRNRHRRFFHFDFVLVWNGKAAKAMMKAAVRSRLAFISDAKPIFGLVLA